MMLDRIADFVFKHPFWSIVMGMVLMMILTVAIWVPLDLYTKQHDLEAVKDAEYVLYQSNGQMKALDSEVIIDMDTGYQYRVFRVHGQYVAVPSIDKDGEFYRTVE